MRAYFRNPNWDNLYCKKCRDLYIEICLFALLNTFWDGRLHVVEIGYYALFTVQCVIFSSHSHTSHS